ncbi:MAG: GNAT family N-acetyltransferase [Alphaproteobacteria bacterium]|nr:GNAT family N-acetyltransferase [Alphaproteobacteria bacterium]
MAGKFTLKDGRQLILRPTEKKDYEAVQDYFEQLGRETIFTYQYPGRPRQTREHFEKSLGTSWGIIALDGEKVAGLVATRWPHPNHPWMKHECEFCVHMLKDYYRQGLGQKFLNLMFDWAKENKISRIEGTVNAENKAGIGLYIKNGFILEGTRRRATFINNKWYDEYYIGRITE